ncbi:phage adaptor protein [Agrobacterium tumefaciens]|uniref:Uncharacterized protein n=1 Tax=Agrobacterium tumefaciens TaxID=358 RepID=A0A176WW68_AGRTU|nr:hypothetical protein [Agrobacterium tumefaciens]OAE37643.1 hypothetical protein A7J57_08680 [Agrobacterium tumefaciens]
MAFSTYSDLKSKIAKYLARSGLDTEIADAIAMFESEYNAGEDNYFSESVFPFTTVAGTALVTLPSDFNEPVSLSMDKYGDVPIISLASLQNRAVVTQGRPTAAALYPGSRLKLSATPDAVYSLELIYEANLAALSDASPTNWMLQKYPNVYVYGALKYMLDYLQDGVRADTIERKYLGFLNGIQGKKASKKLGNNAVMQTSGRLP